jgi:hypothetical protein
MPVPRRTEIERRSVEDRRKQNLGGAIEPPAKPSPALIIGGKRLAASMPDSVNFASAVNGRASQGKLHHGADFDPVIE